MDFAFLGLSDELLAAVREAGYEEPTPIQRQAIPAVLQGRDVIGIAQTGTGKTAGFTLPMLDILAQGRTKARMPRSLILEPTRELAAQVAESFETYGKYHKLSMALLIGGVSFGDQEAKLERGVDVLIATPGRLLDHFERGKLMLSGVKIAVVDECDRMLDMGFIPDVERIFKLMPQRDQTLFFSATLAKEIKRLTDQFLTDPKMIEVAPPASPAETVRQFRAKVSPREKTKALKSLLGDEAITNRRAAFHGSTFVPDIDQPGVVSQRIAGTSPTMKRDLRHFGQNDDVLEIVDFAQEDPPGLGHAFDHERSRHHRKPRKMIVEVFFRQGDVLDRLGANTAFELHESINPNPTHVAWPFGGMESKPAHCAPGRRVKEIRRPVFPRSCGRGN